MILVQLDEDGKFSSKAKNAIIATGSELMQFPAATIGIDERVDCQLD